LKREAEMVHLIHSLREEVRNLRLMRKSILTWSGTDNYTFDIQEPIPTVLKLIQLEDAVENQKTSNNLHRPKPSLTSTSGHPQKF